MSEEIVLAPGISPPELASVANREHALVGQAVGSMVDHAIRAGEALRLAKDSLSHGEWEGWIAANFDGSYSTGALYMRMEANLQRIETLNLRHLGLNAIDKRLARINREEEAETQRNGDDPSAVVADCDLRLGDFREVLADLHGVDAIITDPPYPAEFIEEFDALGEVAARILRPDGILVAMVGQTHLPAYLERLSRHLTYRWCAAYLTTGQHIRVHGRKVASAWKPLLVFERDSGSGRFFLDLFRSDRDDKEHHHWGQSESGFADIIGRLTEPGELVVDPFLGGGTTAIVCRDLGRSFIGCDIDPAAIATTKERLA